MSHPPLTVRAHHLGCLLDHAFQGGSHPTLPILLKEFRTNPARPVRVVVGPDDICIPCPHWDGSACNRRSGMEPKNKAKDKLFLEALGLADGQTISLDDLSDRIVRRLTEAVFASICPTCHPDKCSQAVAYLASHGLQSLLSLHG